jgi:hypothetical protein
MYGNTHHLSSRSSSLSLLWNNDQDDIADTMKQLGESPEAREEILSEGGLKGGPTTAPKTPPHSRLAIIPEPTPLAPWVIQNPIENNTSSHYPSRQLVESDLSFPAPNPWSASDLLSFLRRADGKPSPAIPRVGKDSYVSTYGCGGVRQQQQTRPASGMTSATSRQMRDGQWKHRFQDLLQFRGAHGHVLVPHLYPTEQKLSKWVKRQQYQRLLKERGLRSTLTDEREQLLADVGFVWDSFDASLQDNLESICDVFQVE